MDNSTSQYTPESFTRRRRLQEDCEFETGSYRPPGGIVGCPDFGLLTVFDELEISERIELPSNRTKRQIRFGSTSFTYVSADCELGATYSLPPNVRNDFFDQDIDGSNGIQTFTGHFLLSFFGGTSTGGKIPDDKLPTATLWSGKLVRSVEDFSVVFKATGNVINICDEIAP